MFRSLIFHPHSQHQDVRNSVSSLPTFFLYSENMVNYLPHTHSELHDCYFSRRLSFDHNHLWLGFSSLGEHLFKLNSCASPFLRVRSESVKHFFLYCPRYAAQRNVLLTSAANNVRHGHRGGDTRKLNFFIVRCWVCKLRCQLCFFSANYKFYN